MTQSATVGVLGASGFVGGAVVKALAQHAQVMKIPAPRISPQHLDVDEGAPVFDRQRIEDIASQLEGLDALVNAAGDPHASSMDLDDLLAANATMPVLAYLAGQRAGVPRFVHVSSAVVQGDRRSLDSSRDWRPFSPYALSKVTGERWLLDAANPPTELIIYRPPSVHARGRGVTEKVARLASGPLRSVAGSGKRATPQALLENVADAIAFLAVAKEPPPQIVHHPWEGLTTGGLMFALGGRRPRHLPERFCELVATCLRTGERVIPAIAPNRRRIEMMWFGQDVDTSWLEDVGWTPPNLGDSAWQALVAAP